MTRALVVAAVAVGMTAIVTPAQADLVLDFPSVESLTGGPTGSGPLGEGGGAQHFYIGDEITESFTGTGMHSVRASRWVFTMDDWTDAGVESSFDLLINDTIIASFSFGGEGVHSTMRSFDLAFSHDDGPILGSGLGGDDFVLSMVATSTVPLGMGSWNWVAGGEVTLIPAPAVLGFLGLGLLAGPRRRR